MILLLFLFVAKHLRVLRPGRAEVSMMLSYHLRSIRSRKDVRRESSDPRAVGQGLRRPEEGPQGREEHPPQPGGPERGCVLS